MRGKKKTTSRSKRSLKSKTRSSSVENWLDPDESYQKNIKHDKYLQLGWGKLIFANTYQNLEKFIEELKIEAPDQRNIAFYTIDPHVVVSLAPNEVFLDPSHSFRIPFENYQPARRTNTRLFVRRLTKKKDLEAVNRILLSRNMVPLKSSMVLEQRNSKEILYLVAESTKTGDIVGFVNGVDHYEAFNDPEKGTSLWSLAVDPKSALPGIGEALTRYLIEYFIARKRSYLDLSVMHGNEPAIRLYKKLGFRRTPVFCVKLKNTINESLYTSGKFKNQMNPYAQIIVNEAMRRGIEVDILDKKAAYFSLSHGGKKITCRESLTDLTSAIAMSRCIDKTVTSSLLRKNKVSVPDQITYHSQIEEAYQFLKKYKKVVVKPSNGEQGADVKVGITTKKDLKSSLMKLTKHHNKIVIEEMVEGFDIRFIIINHQFVAAAIRRPPEIVGDGKTTVKNLINRLNKRRMAATQGESHVPFDDETHRTLKTLKLDLDTVIADGRIIQVRKTANVHTGGTISDITAQIPHWLIEKAQEVSRILEIPVTGLDIMIPSLEGKKYWIIEANERPGLANHEPQPTTEKFIDFLFPLTRKDIIYEQSIYR
ncbi:MAG: N-acetylglutaminylglutamine synthetase [Halobacteriovoraceae bacterium]|nr:N-acetylglutaminylglutamine synthetase [Halobacteriovoraceae bacterium]MCB9095264.1 N-acetylglutaminylglutamine synthetase [Halobacteriovoraceae bacterium]